MNIVLILAPLAAVLIAVIYGITKLVQAGKANVSNKKMFDSGKEIETAIRSYISREISVIGVAVAILFIILLYLLGWKIAISFLTGAAVTILINRINALLIARSYSRLVDLARTDQIKSANKIIGISGASSVFAFGSAVLISVLIYAIFKDVSTLVALTLGAVLIEIISRLNLHSSDKAIIKNENDHSSAGLIGVVFALSAVGTYFAVSTYPGDERASYLSLLLLGSGMLAALIGLIFTRVKNSGGTFRLALTYNIIPAVILLAGSYFLSKWAITGEGGQSPLHIFLSFSIGAVVPLILLAKGYWIQEKMKLAEANSKLITNIILAILAVASILGSYYLAGYFGIAVSAIGATIYLIPMMSSSRAIAIYQNADATRELAGVETDLTQVKAVYESVRKLRGYLGTYPAFLGTLASIAVLFLYFQRIAEVIPTVSFNLNDPYLISGIVFGGLISYYLAVIIEGNVKHGLIIPISVMIALITLIGIFLGIPVALGAVLGFLAASVILAVKDDRVTLTLGSLMITAASILFIPILSLSYSIRAKSIIGIALIVMILAYILVTRTLKKEAK